MTKDFSRFRRKIVRLYAKEGRHDFLWRKTRDPYAILVSEIMLQQTQVDRVIPKYRSFLRKFPSVKKLAVSSLGAVLREWQGLGYNRRARMLHEAAKSIVALHAGEVPVAREDLERLPGVGHYTAGAIRAFAFDAPDDFLETNIRTALIYEFFPKHSKIADQDLLKILPLLRGRTSPRLFYSALMDYGASLKKQGMKLNAKSKHYVKQKQFRGSDREVRGAILRTLAEKKPVTSLAFERKRIERALASLLRENLIEMRSGTCCLPK